MLGVKQRWLLLAAYAWAWLATAQAQQTYQGFATIVGSLQVLLGVFLFESQHEGSLNNNPYPRTSTCLHRAGGFQQHS